MQDKVVEEITQQANTAGEDIKVEIIGNVGKQIKEAQDKAVDKVSQSVTATNEKLKAEVTGTVGTQIKEAQEKAVNKIAQRVNATSENLKTAVTSTVGAQIKEAQDKAVDKIAQSVNATSENLKTAVTSTVGAQIKEAQEKAVDQIAQRVNATSEDVKAEVTNNVKTQIKEASNKSVETLTQCVKTTGEDIKAGVTNNVNTKIKEANQMLAQKINRTGETIRNELIDQVGTQLKEAHKRATRSLKQHISATGQNLKTAVAQKVGAQITQANSKAIETLTQHVKAAGDDIKTDVTSKMSAQIKQGNEHVIRQLAEQINANGADIHKIQRSVTETVSQTSAESTRMLMEQFTDELTVLKAEIKATILEANITIATTPGNSGAPPPGPPRRPNGPNADDGQPPDPKRDPPTPADDGTPENIDDRRRAEDPNPNNRKGIPSDEDDKPEEEDPDEPIYLQWDNQEVHLKELIFEALQMPDDKATRRRIQKLQKIERHIKEDVRLSLYSNILDLLCQTPSNRWPQFDESVCPICNEKFENASQKNAHMVKIHSENVPDFLMQSLCKLFDCAIKHYEGTQENHREAIYEPHCHYPLCKFSSEEYTAILKHRRTHQHWGRRIRTLGPFWARLKEEVLQGEKMDSMPTPVDLLGTHITYSCPKCNFENDNEGKVQKHVRKQHHIREPQLIESTHHYELEKDLEFAKMMEQQDPGVFIDQSQQFLEAREKLTQIGWNYDKFCKLIEHPDEMYRKILRLKNPATCARALQDVKEWRELTNLELYPTEQIKMTSNIATLLHACRATALPLMDGRKECHLCHKLYSYNKDLEVHMRETHGEELETNMIKRFIQHVTGKTIVSLRINALKEMEVEDIYPHTCPVPKCTFRTPSHEDLHQHLLKMTDPIHARTARLMQTLGAFWGPIKAFVDEHNALPKLRDILGYTSLPYKLCTVCRRIVSSNQIEKHLRAHKLPEINPIEQVDTVKYWTEFNDEIIQEATKTKEWCNLIWNGTRDDLELMTDYMWRKAMVETDEDRQRLREMEHILAQRHIAYWTEEEEANERREFPDENLSDSDADTAQYQIIPERIVTVPAAPEPEPEPEEDIPMDIQILGVEQYKLLELLTSEDLSFKEIVNILERGLKQTEDRPNFHLNVLEQFNRYNLKALKEGYECYLCKHTARNDTALFTHMAKAHNIMRSDWFLASLEPFLGCQCTMQIVANNVELPRLVSCCWHPQCTYCQADKTGLKVHIKNQHPRYFSDIEKYGIVLATLRAHLKHHQFVRWQQILAERPCITCNCGATFSNQASINKHWAQSHSKDTIGNWRAATEVGEIRIELTQEQRNQEERPYVAPQNVNRVPAYHHREPEHIPRNVEAEAHLDEPPQIIIPDNPVPEDNTPEPRRAEQHERINAQATEEIPDKSYWHRRRELLRTFTDNGINMVSIKPQHVPQVREGLETLFKEELLPLIKAEDHWDVYEGKYMETLHRMRTHITQKQGRDPNKIYTYQPRNKDIDAMTLRALSHQKIETKLHQILKYINKLIIDTEEEALTQQRRVTYLNKVSHVLRETCPDEADAIMDEITGSADHQQRALEWIASKIIEASQQKVDCTNTRTPARVIRQMYHEDPGTAFRRYVDPRTSPSCEIPLNDIEEYYGAVWAQETEPTPTITMEDIPKHIETDLSEDIIKFMTCEENIKKVVQTRKKQSALGPDGVGYRIYQLGGAPAIQYLKELFTRILEHKKVPQDWLEAHTILLHKKGAEDNLSNWRPISITCCTYRIFTALLSRALQTLNQTEQFYSKTQKGFIQKCNGCTEHSILINELMAQANRDKTSLIATTIDCTNAFGSVPHALIFEVMKAMNIPSIVQHIVRELYTNASTKIKTTAGTTSKISWRRGVKQGCPLSPLLFNMCLEPLLHTIRCRNSTDGLIYGAHRLQVQAYADDVVLLAETPNGMRNLLDTTAAFMQKSLMSINPAKCVCASYMINKDRRRCSIPSMQINGEDIKCLTLAESCRYLGSPLAANAKTRIKANEIHVTETEILLEKVLNSELAINQKLHAIKTFVIPHLDFRFLNTDMSRSRIKQLNKKIRGSIARMFRIKGLPKVNVHTSWRDGGLSIPSLQDRQDVLCIRAFHQMYTSSDETTRELFKMMIDSEKKARKVASDEPGEFLNWNRHTSSERKGNRTLISRTRNVAEKRQIKLEDNGETLQITMQGKAYHPTPTNKVTLGRFLTSQIRKEYLEARKEMPTTCDCLLDATNNPDSNFMVKGTKPYTNGLVRFMIAARNNLLPTPANIERWQERDHQPCQCGCKGCEVHTLSHILNSCGYNRAEIIARHDKIVSITRELIAKTIRNAELLADNSNVLETDRPEKPDLVINSERRILIIDITCPYGGTSHTQRSLENAHNQKITKYEDLRQFLAEQHRKTAIVIPIVISSLGIAYRKSIQLLAQILKLKKSDVQTFTKRATAAALRGSLEIWSKHVREKRRETTPELEEEEKEIRLSDEEQIIDEDEPELPYEIAPLPLSDEEIVEAPPDFDPRFEGLFQDRTLNSSSDENPHLP